MLLQVKVEYHITYGLKLNILDVDPRFTLGKLAMERQLTLNRLVEENPDYVFLADGEYTSFNKLRVPPNVIQRIALIGSPGTDGFRDFVHELESNLFNYKFRIDQYPAAVQGIDADTRMTEKLIEIVTLGIHYDAVVIVRGGGADTDLVAFDSYLLSRAIARFPVPVITGIGHTRNESVADLMAWRALKTPTKAAAFIIDRNRNFEDLLFLEWEKITRCVPKFINNEKEELNFLQSTFHASVREVSFVHREILTQLQNNLGRKALAKIEYQSAVLDSFGRSLKQTSRHFLQMQDEKLGKLGQAIKMMGPETILKRGFALVFKEGKVVRDASSLNEGEKIETHFYKSIMTSRVTEVNLRNGETNL